MLARLCSTLDGIAEGRFGWNIVTSGEDGSAQNFGMDKFTEHSLRYDIADDTSIWFVSSGDPGSRTR
jgi:alkanesulfonate monooxygenase SsuD/methylene tetrahydromethanopterin reductase-like flavin-dependent oxidoreductase (luciferase family)